MYNRYYKPRRTKMIEMIMVYWPVLPSIIAVASVIAKITPNETDDKIVAELQKIIDFFALTTGKTILKK